MKGHRQSFASRRRSSQANGKSGDDSQDFDGDAFPGSAASPSAAQASNSSSEFMDGPLQEAMQELKRQAGAAKNAALNAVVNQLQQVPVCMGLLFDPFLSMNMFCWGSYCTPL